LIIVSNYRKIFQAAEPITTIKATLLRRTIRRGSSVDASLIPFFSLFFYIFSGSLEVRYLALLLWSKRIELR
jgi:hypothetical protein